MPRILLALLPLVLLLISTIASAAARIDCLPLSDAEPLGIHELEAFLNRCEIGSIDQLIPLLPASLRSRYALVYDSRALFRDSVDADHPRVILFGKDARLILAFTGNPEKAGFNTLEAISFDEKKARFTIHAAELMRPQKIFGDNPAACMGCHGNDPRPIWDTDPIWGGAYGSVHDELLPGSDEERKFTSFADKAREMEVYRHFTRGFPLDQEKGFQNGRFTLALSDLNSRRMARRLQESPGFKADPSGLTALLLGCRRAANEDATLADQTRISHLHFDRRMKRMGLPPAPFPAGTEVLEDDVRVRIAAEAAGLDFRGWTTTFENNSFLFSSGGTPITQLILSRLSERLDAARDAKLISALESAGRADSRDFGPLLPFSSLSPKAAIEGVCRALGH